jgi:hypothetical protein
VAGGTNRTEHLGLAYANRDPKKANTGPAEVPRLPWLALKRVQRQARQDNVTQVVPAAPQASETARRSPPLEQMPGTPLSGGGSGRGDPFPTGRYEQDLAVLPRTHHETHVVPTTSASPIAAEV